MIVIKPVRKIKRIEDLPRDEVIRQRQVVAQGGKLPRPVLERELARFKRVKLYANYW
jgi:hypothetical protein